MEQPFPKNPKENVATISEETPVKKGGIQGIIAMLKALAGKSPKAKLILTLGAFTISVIIFLSITSLFTRRTPGEAPIPTMPTPVQSVPTISPKPTPGQEKTNQLLEDIDAFDPTKKDLGLPSVDLKIGL